MMQKSEFLKMRCFVNQVTYVYGQNTYLHGTEQPDRFFLSTTTKKANETKGFGHARLRYPICIYSETC